MNIIRIVFYKHKFYGMNYSKFLIAGLTGLAAAIIIKKLVQKKREVFDDIIFDSEFIPGFNKMYPSTNEIPSHFRHSRLYSEDADGPVFV